MRFSNPITAIIILAGPLSLLLGAQTFGQVGIHTLKTNALTVISGTDLKPRRYYGEFFF